MRYLNTCASRAEALAELAWRRSIGPAEDDLSPVLAVVVDEEFNKYTPDLSSSESFLDGTLEA